MAEMNCPHCGQPMDHIFDERVRRVRRACRDLHIDPLPGGYLWEGDAARVMGLSPDTLRKQAAEGRCRVAFELRGNRRCYALSDIAEFF
ncbi:hypothetical protein [Pseudohaliea sp.]|uniref:hypothetical protein n=1 Tax=Pseudohaliea sp. TaxID=2740289 RepID=UPI0032EAACB6